MTRNWDEALLVAYVDRELDPEGIRRAERAIAADPEARALVDLLHRSADAARSAFAEPLNEPPPRRLVEMIERHRDATRPVHPRIVQGRNRPARRSVPLALAASLAALIIGFGGGYLYRDATVPGYGLAGSSPEPASSGFQAALASLLADDTGGRSADYAAAGGQGTVTVLGPVGMEHGLSCRAFENRTPVAVEAGIACRTDDGGWSVLVVPRERS